MELKSLKSLDLKQQLLFVESYLPDAWEYLHDTGSMKLPIFDENDNVVSWGVAAPQDTPKLPHKKKRSDYNEGFSESWPCAEW